MRRRRAGRAQRLGRRVADVAVARELDPAPAVARLERGEALAGERLGVEGCVGARRAAQRRGGRDHAHRRALDEARRLDSPAQPRVGEVGTEGVEAGVHAEIRDGVQEKNYQRSRRRPAGAREGEKF